MYKVASLLALFLSTGSHAQSGPTTSSSLLRLPLTPGAVRITDAAATREFAGVLNALAQEQGSGCQASEYLAWNDARVADQIGAGLNTQFKARAMTFEPLDESEDEESYTLSFLLREKQTRYVAVLYGDTESVVLGWCQLKAAQANSTTPQKPVTTPQKTATTPQPAAQPSGVTPQPGAYRGELTGDFKGNEISFRVSADGKTISAITMTGYWRCSDSLSNTTYKTNPRMVGELGGMPGTVPVQGGAFSATAKAPYLLWEFGGRFTGKAVAEGSFLVEASDCTSYKLKFKATRTGS